MSFAVLLSYARQDASVAAWLRSRMSVYRTPRSLVGTRAALGPVPARIELMPARDADAHDLDESRALVVICSAAAAADADVNRDIDSFISRGRTRRILPVIVPDAPETQDVQRDYFPPAISGRGLFTVDLRERRVGDVLSGDGREGGWLKLVAELLGVDLARLAEHEGRRNNTRSTVLTVALAACAFAAIGAGAYALRTQQRADAVESQRQTAASNAMRSLQLQREAISAAEQQAAAQAAAGREFSRAKTTLLGAVRDLGSLSNAILDDVSGRQTADAGDARKLVAIERAYWDLADISPYFEIPPATITAMMERIAATYTQLGRTDEARRVDARLQQFTERVVHNRSANPAWRTAYAAAVVTFGDHRGANSDDAGKAAALEQAGHIYEDVCLATPPEQTRAVNDLRASACLRFANMTLARAAQQKEAQQHVDTAPLQRARIVLEAAIAAFPNNNSVQTRAPRLRDQIDRTVEAANTPVTASAARD